ncbi:MAG: undecaprenyldiphospho-muramoylpentapeptide beta-N-acetylglucosaminyltransferase [Deltaproteobacteria bacterium RIFCSPLOWO2_12_FULL_60_19]|nr:MAG: undecaprenyldiphospho-muramoylpentapeptide beta-N-acetylglucosaminyltransferase [Deltaproteobacteria bacterium RIFCSPLOWO2_12_FULL_60_19]
MRMRVIMAGGGTGGHLFPGLAVAEEFRNRDPMAEILFVGTEAGIESRAVPAAGFPLETIPVRGLKGRGGRGLIDALYGVPASVCRSLKIIRRFRPDCVIGLGGYASGPVVAAARLTGVRSAIMEQNLRPGLTNRILGRAVNRIFTSYDGSAAFFPRGKVVETGNPVRWRKLPEVRPSGKFTLLIFGGSAGAHRINVGAVETMKGLVELASGIKVIHQTGAADLEWTKSAYAALPFEVELLPFIDKMDEAYARADLVVCRAGATTIAELTVFGKPAILIPYPYAADDHQRFNAEALKEQGAAEMILERELDGTKLTEQIRRHYLNRARLQAMGKAALGLGRPEAAKKIVDECYALVREA